MQAVLDAYIIGLSSSPSDVASCHFVLVRNPDLCNIFESLSLGKYDAETGNETARIVAHV